MKTIDFSTLDFIELFAEYKRSGFVYLIDFLSQWTIDQGLLDDQGATDLRQELIGFNELNETPAKWLDYKRVHDILEDMETDSPKDWSEYEAAKTVKSEERAEK